MKAPLGRRVAHGAVRVYQVTLSGVIGRQCRYLPTCSHYADQAIARHGVWAGAWMGAGRICRCHPWGGAGFDPVPLTLAPGSHWRRPWQYLGRQPRPDEGDHDRASSAAESA